MIASSFRAALSRGSRRGTSSSIQVSIPAALSYQTLSYRSFRFFSNNNSEDDSKKKPEIPKKEETKKSNGVMKQRNEEQRVRDELPVTYADISRAHVAIRDGVVRTKCEQSYFLSELVGANIYIKPEFRQFTGSFKERGARNAILQLKREFGDSLTGVIAASAGNHALALAYHGKNLNVPVTVVMPTVAPLAKVDKCRVSGMISFVWVEFLLINFCLSSE